MNRRVMALLAPGFLLLGWSPSIEGQCVNTDPFFSSSGNTIRVSNGFGASSSLLESGTSQWATCAGYGSTFPSFTTAAVSTPREVEVYYYGGHSGASHCGLHTRSGSLSTIEIWDQAFNSSGNTVTCQPPTWILAHELGHALGLRNSTCSDYIMSFNPMSSVQSAECSAVDGMWETDWESDDPCDWPNPPQGCDNGQDPPYSPIVVDLDGRGFRFTDAGSGVEFDIDGDGVRERMAWTRPESGEAFLWLDRNQNGRVDDGGELFGNFTRLRTGQLATNGYVALAELDDHAMNGNGNGVVDPGDEGFSRLKLWLDTDHDGLLDTGEAIGLASVGITRIDLDYRTLGRKDPHGNYLRFESQAWSAWTPRRLKTVDVFFLIASGP